MDNIFIDSNKNDELSLLRGIDLQELLVETENYLLKYRDTLCLPKNFTFGVEIEYEDISRFLTNIYIKTMLPLWNSKKDGSLSIGGEISSPVMLDKTEYWKQLKKVCDHLSRRGANTIKKAGGHIHIGINAFDGDIEAWKTFIKLYTAYENVIFRFIYGDKINGRKDIEYYAFPVADKLYNSICKINNSTNLSELYHNLPTYVRYQALNFGNIDFNDSSCCKNTLEFRSPNATTNAVIWQNNINAFTKMIKASKDKRIDVDFLDYKLTYEYVSYRYNDLLYECINLKNVLEFIDLVFDNNLDKIYFLRQYLKSFQEVYKSDETIKTKKFVR